MKKIIFIFIVLLLCAGFTGSASAWYSNSEASVSPSGSLTPGESVFATIQEIIVDTNGINTGDYIYLRTPLDSAQWSIDIKYRNSDTPLSSREGSGKSMQISGFELSYGEDVTLVVSLNGVVSSSSAGQEISVITIEQSPAKGTATYSSPVQKVYNPADLPEQISAVQVDVTTLDSRITEASKLGVDVSSAVSRLENAKSYLSSASNAGSGNVATASSNLANAETALTEAERLLVSASLSATKSNLDEIDTILSQLSAKGWNDNRVILLTTTKQGAKNLYDTGKSAYDATTGKLSSTATSQVNEALIESSNSLSTAKGLLEESEKSIFDNLGPIIPFIIIGLVAVIVLAGLFIYLRNRDDGWDELG